MTDDLRAIHRLGNYISVWIWSTGEPPEPVNTMWINWLDRGKIPTREQVEEAIKKSNDIRQFEFMKNRLFFT